MLLQSHSRYFSSSPLCTKKVQPRRRKMEPPKAFIHSFAEISHNKVLIAAALSSAIGQLTKPLSGTILYGESFNIKAIFQAGGFPSSHSSAVVATATCIGLERGFSDAIFGLAIVYASLTMYDAQGVRREVGTHAKALNRMFGSRLRIDTPSPNNGDSLNDSSSENSSSKLESPKPFLPKEEPSKSRSRSSRSSLSLGSDNRMNQSTSVLISSSLGCDEEEGLGNGGQYSDKLKESVGHTEIEVIAGALLGFCVSLAVYSV